MAPSGRPSLDGLLLLLVDEMSALLRRRVEELGLSVPQAFALRLLDHPLPMRNLAAAMHCDASNLTGIADRLEERGLAERRLDPRDRRVKLLVLTDEGRRARSALHRSVAEELPGIARLSAAQREHLELLLWEVLRP